MCRKLLKMGPASVAAVDCLSRYPKARSLGPFSFAFSGEGEPALSEAEGRPRDSRRDVGATLPYFLYIDLGGLTAHNPLLRPVLTLPGPPVPDIRMATPNAKIRLILLRAQSRVAWLDKC